MYSKVILHLLTLMYLVFAVTILIKIGLIFDVLNTTNGGALGSKSLNKTTKILDLEVLRFNDYISRFNKNYSAEEYQIRLDNFRASLLKIKYLNSMRQSATFGLTKFSDMSEQEFADRMLMKRQHNVGSCTNYEYACPITFNSRFHSEPIKTALQKKQDWREKGVIGPIQDQKQCQACWALSVAGVMEAMMKINKPSNEELSAQEILDCLVDNQQSGCRGGNVAKTLIVLCSGRYGRSIVTAQEYPLTLRNEKCLVGRKASGVWLKQFSYRCNRSEEEIQRALLQGPVTAIVNAGIWRHYLGGIIQRHCTRNQNSYEHAIQIVGYDQTGDIPFYIVKNSWGNDFGDNGYVKLEMYKNMCGVAEEIGTLDVVDHR